MRQVADSYQIHIGENEFGSILSEKNYINALASDRGFRAKKNHGEAAVIDWNRNIALRIIKTKLEMLIHTFLPIFPFKEDMVFFSSLRRYALPLMMQAGKYLGKRLLASGQNIVEDVSRGKSFRHTARDQLHQSGRDIKADILRKLQGGGRVKRKKSQRPRQTKRQKPNPTDVFSNL
ncbi:uncharacterized protein TNCT_15371 [Trichonephila clavata]|uniref:Uncharacterized protein n=1 Tax=Trichonephila clavata TaxID=2740835 RepID=A0A8X6I7F9_TRICU|nr:uncharacterized protein TNCT_15371 [Trichonephila clavata]